jgi:streptogramin lyase/mono/diheme cytochrome c family protein
MGIVKLVGSAERRSERLRQIAVGVALGCLVFGTSRPNVAAQSGAKDPALQGLASLSGTVTAGKPFKAAQVYIRNVDKRMLYMVYTNAGAFRAVALLPGNYEINVQAKGGLESDVQKLVVKAGDHPNLKVSLREAANTDQFPSAVPRQPIDWGGTVGASLPPTSPMRPITFQDYAEIYPPGPGKEVLEQVCMVCHTGENFFPLNPRNEAGWKQAIDRMTSRGMLAGGASNFRFGPQDRQDVLAYLTKNFGPDSKLRAVRTDQEIPLDEANLGKAQFIEYYMVADLSKGASNVQESRDVEGGGPGRRRVGITMQLDGQGNVWMVENSSRLVKLDPRTGQQKDFKLPDHPKYGIHEILIDRTGMIWIPANAPTGPRLLQFDSKTEQWAKQIDPDPDNVIPSPKGGLLGTTLDSKGNIYMNWMGSGAIGRWDRSTGKISIFRVPTNHARPYGQAIDRNDNVFAALWNSGNLTKLDTTTNQWTEFTPPTHPGNLRRGPGVDSQNNVWFGIWAAGNRPGKLAKLDQTTGRITEWTIPHRAAMPYEASPDGNDNIWFPDTGTPDHPATLGRFNPRDQTFTFYPKPQFVAETSKIQHSADGAVWYSPRYGAPDGATGFAVLYPDMDKITTLAAHPLNGPPGYAFKVAP